MAVYGLCGPREGILSFPLKVYCFISYFFNETYFVISYKMPTTNAPRKMSSCICACKAKIILGLKLFHFIAIFNFLHDVQFYMHFLLFPDYFFSKKICLSGQFGNRSGQTFCQSKKGGKYQESIQSSTFADPGYHMGK